WELLGALAARGVRFMTLTHAAGISSTGDELLDRRWPLPEAYRIPAATARAVATTRTQGGRIVAMGTTVVRALEHAAAGDGQVRAGEGLATQRIGPHTRLRVVDAIVSGTHEAGTSHYELLQAFAALPVLARAARELDAHAYRTHEFGDSVLVERHAAEGSDCGCARAA
ncbi:MAG TPA: S-adenosylmethionine:tRNA ribosyltransferase-isomerase, partial [Nevskiaceae bacterium]|nr:S-adenosylmethionine:tRNA ribosyltransferase-isomerase [Nevskiaceae bacterium]